MSNIDKQALRNLAVAAKLAPSWYAVGEFGDVVDPAKPEWKPVHEFCKTFTAARVLALLDELESAERRIAELEARDKPKFVQCWSCKHDIEVLAVADCDGYCPRCAAPIDLDNEPYAAAGKGE